MPTAVLRQRARRILQGLAKTDPVPGVELHHRSPLQLLIATILSAQCTDQRVNMVTPALFQRYQTAGDYAAADQSKLESLIRSTGFYKSKARSIIGCCTVLTQRFGGRVPDRMDDLVTLPGVGRKTANVVLGNAFDKPAVIVDTHVTRVAQRLGLAKSNDAERIELDLQSLMPEKDWTVNSQRILLHGRYICLARKPRCADCSIYALCRWKGKLKT